MCNMFKIIYCSYGIEKHSMSRPLLVVFISSKIDQTIIECHIRNSDKAKVNKFNHALWMT